LRVTEAGPLPRRGTMAGDKKYSDSRVEAMREVMDSYRGGRM